MKCRYLLILAISALQCRNTKTITTSTENIFPKELVHFVAYKSNPLFSGTGKDTWDKQMRERGYIIREDNIYHLWYTGYEKNDGNRSLGYATSTDGISFSRHPQNPVHEANWVEDMCVVKSKDNYYMFAEGKGDSAHLLISKDKIHWQEKGQLDIRQTNGQPISKGAFGTPAVIIDKGVWYLFYERDDRGIWLATSKDHTIWTNVQDDPVIKMGSICRSNESSYKV